MLAEAERVTGMDSSKLVKGALRAVLPCLLDGCDVSTVCCFDGQTGRQVCALKDAVNGKGEDLQRVLRELTAEVNATPQGAIHGPVQFRPADEAERARRVRDRLQIAEDWIRQLKEGLQ